MSSLRRRVDRPLLCSVVEGELRGLAICFKWGTDKIARLDQLCNELVSVSCALPEVISAYAQLYAHVRAKGTPIGENDLWIAATAQAAGATLLACDTDFDKIDGTLLDHVYVAPHLKS